MKSAGQVPFSLSSFDALTGYCQSNANQSPIESRAKRSSGRQFAPLGQGGRAVSFEYGPSAEMTIVVEAVVDRSVGGVLSV
jgi:hypothetical protein